MDLKFVDVRGYKAQVKRLFLTAFPREERPPLWMMRRRCTQGTAKFSAIVDGDTFVGLTYVVGTDKVKTLMFLAIDDSARDKGYGSKVLDHDRKQYPDVKLF